MITSGVTETSVLRENRHFLSVCNFSMRGNFCSRFHPRRRRLKLKKITLVNPPKSCFDKTELSPPLGLLRLADIALGLNFDPKVIDFNLHWHLANWSADEFYSRASVMIAADAPDVVAITSMAVDSHVALRLGKAVKDCLPDTTIIFGGAHFSSVAESLLLRHPWIDAIVCGPGESGFAQVLKGLTDCTKTPRLVIAEQEIPRCGISADAYALVDTAAYLGLNPLKKFDFEGGRGCRFACSFCYSPAHYSSIGNLSVESRLHELQMLSAMGVKHVFFVEDNFVNWSDQAHFFCERLREANLDLTWSCYATLPNLDAAILASMASAGCEAIFLGIDAIGRTSQRMFRKAFVKGSDVLDHVLNICKDLGIRPTCAFLLSPPGIESSADQEATLITALRARRDGADVRLNTLTLYPGTPMYGKHNGNFYYDEHKAEMLMDLPRFVVENEYAKDETQTHLFPFHNSFVPPAVWQPFVEDVHCLFTLLFARSEAVNDVLKSGFCFSQMIAGVTGAVPNPLTIHPRDRRLAQVTAFDRIYAF